MQAPPKLRLWGRPRLSKNLRFSDNLCLDCAKHGREKFLYRNFFSLKV